MEAVDRNPVLRDPPKTHRSKVWEYFGLKENVKDQTTCKLCFANITYKTGSTTAMRGHLKRKHGIACSTGESDKATSSSSKVNSPMSSDPVPPPKQMKLTQLQTTKYGRSSPRFTTISRAIGGYLASDMRPYSTVQSEGFKYMLKVLEPRYELPCRTHFSQKVIPELMETVVAKMKKELQKATYIAITTDSWISRATENFVAVTAHFINSDWEVEDYTLQTKKFSDSHTSENLATGLKEVVAEWNLSRNGKGPAISTDNARNIVNGVKEAGSKPHIPCFAHTLNLATQRGMKVTQMDRLLGRVRRVVSFFHKSTTATSNLKRMQTRLEIPQHKLLIDVQTRWNSSYDMLERYLEQQAAVFAALLEVKKNAKDIVTLSDNDVHEIEEVIKILKPLKTVTTLMCSSKHPTVSHIHPLKERIMKQMEVKDTDTQLVTAVKTAITADLKPRYSDPEILQFILEVSALDLRFKNLPYINDKQRLDVYNNISLDLLETNETVSVKKESEDDDTDLHSVPDLPTLRTPKPRKDDDKPVVHLENSADSRPGGPDTGVGILGDIFGDVFIMKVEAAPSISSRVDSELRQYKDETSLDLSGNPLLWWISREGKYPLLSQLARQYLGIPATCVASERVFSTAADIVTAQRACLSSEQVDMLVCLSKNLNIPSDLM